MNKDTFLQEMSKLNKEVSLYKVSQTIGYHYNTVRNYVLGEGENVEVMCKILSASKDQIKNKAEQLLSLV